MRSSSNAEGAITNGGVVVVVVPEPAPPPTVVAVERVVAVDRVVVAVDRAVVPVPLVARGVMNPRPGIVGPGDPGIVGAVNGNVGSVKPNWVVEVDSACWSARRFVGAASGRSRDTLITNPTERRITVAATELNH